MKLVALDLETTGLDPQRHDILQIGAVIFDSETGEMEHEFNGVVHHDLVVGEPYALQMNAWLLKKIANEEGHDLKLLLDMLSKFLGEYTWEDYGGGPPVAVGFNVAPFDLAFLNRFTDMRHSRYFFHHRAVELGTLLMSVNNSPMPVRSSEAIKLLGEDREVSHDALQDAKDAVELYMLATK